MSNAYLSRVCIVHHRPNSHLPTKHNLVSQLFRSFSSCTSLAIHPTKTPACLLTINPSALSITAQLSAANTAQRSEEWFALRKDRLTTSTFSTALGFWKEPRRAELWSEKVFPLDTKVFEQASMRAMEWGVLNESVAIDKYKSITGNDVGILGFAIHSEQKYDWLGASPDGLLNCAPNKGILEVKCPFNKGKPELALPWSKAPFYYMPQIQGQMEIMDRDWVDLYCWTPNASSIFRVNRDRGYWELIHEVLSEFWWENVIPAREALLVGGEEAANFYKPPAQHRLTGLLKSRSIKLAAEAKLLCKEIAGHVEFHSC